jgi:hypothetical protein
MYDEEILNDHTYQTHIRSLKEMLRLSILFHLQKDKGPKLPIDWLTPFCGAG